ncbi:MAG TPA: hypothetical protein VKU00_25455 [Chthonomonadaceae bacterium]|nr:hypothetical protein [Chthonomonadaceae bacterium]
MAALRALRDRCILWFVFWLLCLTLWIDMRRKTIDAYGMAERILAIFIIGFFFAYKNRDDNFNINRPSTEHNWEQPSRFTELLFFFLSGDERDAVLGDIDEEYHTVLIEAGERKAKFLYCKQFLTSYWPLLVSWLVKLCQVRLRKAGK